MTDDKKKQEEKAQKKHAHGEGPVTDAKAHADKILQDLARPVEIGGHEIRDLSAEQADELIPDDPRDLLGGRELLHHLPADGLLLDALRELLDDGKRDIGLEQGEADLPESGFQVVLGQMPFAPQLLEDALNSVAQTLEHP